MKTESAQTLNLIAVAIASIMSATAAWQAHLANTGVEAQRESRLELTDVAEAGIEYARLLGGGDTNNMKKMAGIMFFRSLRIKERDEILGALAEVDRDLASLTLYQSLARGLGATNAAQKIASIAAPIITGSEGPLKHADETPVAPGSRPDLDVVNAVLRDNTREKSGWIYLGIFNGSQWSNQTIITSGSCPIKLIGLETNIINDVYLRKERPIETGAGYTLLRLA